MGKPGNTGIARIIRAAGFSRAGLIAAWQNEAAFRQELALLAVAVPLAFWLGNSGIDYALMIGSVILVIIVELLNSAIESVVDRIGSEQHELSGRAKDIGSAAVLIALINATLIWMFVLI